jgi:hypothetical protein
MHKMIIAMSLFLLVSAPASADWLEEVTALHDEIRSLTRNDEGLSDEQRLQRFYTLSYGLTMLENPGFATGLGDPRGQAAPAGEQGLARTALEHRPLGLAGGGARQL